MNYSLLSLPLTALLCARCTSLYAHWHAAGDPDRAANGVLITPDDLFGSRTDLVQVLASRIANAQLVTVDGCQSMQIWGRKSILSPVLPAVYVDGQHTMSSWQ